MIKIMYLTAITLGYAVPPGNFDASVHSVFHSAMNLRLMNGEGLLTLVQSSEPDLPQGIRLNTPEGFSFKEFQIGEPVVCRNGILTFETTHLAVELSEARRWECDLSKLEIDMAAPAVSTAWSVVWEALNKRQQGSNADIIADDLFSSDEIIQRGSISSRAGKAIRALVNAAQHFDLAGTAAAEALIGLGTGLTPSGDDLLAGYMAGLWCTVQGKCEREKFAAELEKKIVTLSARTNDISRTYLFYAAQRQASSRLSALAEAINRGEESDHLLVKAESAMQMGNTSGMDAVTGMLVGISTWKNQPGP
jgi:hypothetical protein